MGIDFLAMIETNSFTNINVNVLENTFHKSRFIQILSNLSEIALSLILPVLCLFLIVLRRVFINLPYKLWVRRYSVYILVRGISMLILYSFSKTLNIGMILHFELALFDTRVYISSSRAFYVLLKGRRDEALYHSSRSDYLEKKKIANQFYCTKISTFLMLFVTLLCYTSDSVYAVISILYEPSFLQSLSFGYFPKLFLPWNTLAYKIQNISTIITGVSACILALYTLFAYLLVSVGILVKLYIKRRKFNHVNDWLTQPLMDSYRCHLEERTQQRPPFIQAFRSGLVY